MNIFLPFEKDIDKSVESLDDLRLRSQILEAYTLLSNAVKEKNGKPITGYKTHPVYLFYKDNLPFLLYYGLACCKEYYQRFFKIHNIEIKFYQIMKMEKITFSAQFTPFYAEGSLYDKNYMRTTENVGELFRKKLCEKWKADEAKGRPPKWTRRKKPDFWEKEIKN